MASFLQDGNKNLNYLFINTTVSLFLLVEIMSRGGVKTAYKDIALHIGSECLG